MFGPDCGRDRPSFTIGYVDGPSMCWANIGPFGIGSASCGAFR